MWKNTIYSATFIFEVEYKNVWKTINKNNIIN